MLVYVGAYTGPGKAEGISVFRMDTSSGALTHVHTVETDNPSFLAFGPRRRSLYACNESGEGNPGPGVSAFKVDPETGTFTALNRQSSHGTSPCYVSVDPKGRYVLVANYGTGTVAAYPLLEDGRLGEASDVVQHAGSGPIPRRQQGPRAHFIAPDFTGERILSCDLGVDKIFVYRLTEDGRLQPNDLPFAQVSSGAGPRHLAFHPSGRFVYVNNEIDSTISAFAYDADRGAFQILQTLSTLPEDFSGNNSTAQIVVHPNGRFVYVSNRGHDSIAIFRIDQETGRLRVVGHELTQGENPRNFAIDPSGTFLLAGNSVTHTIVTFRVNSETGQLSATGDMIETRAPVCILFGQE
ncbi:MAG TPA: lactonase family protein [Chloroflexota bacterium]|nr:lactonase family protein [Chloroflexota bacterium]